MPVHYVQCPGLNTELDCCLCLCHQYKASQGVQFYKNICHRCPRYTPTRFKNNGQNGKAKKKKGKS